MCLLIVLQGLDPAFPVLVAANRDEARDRPSAPPGLWQGARRRVLCPRDRRAGGTWLGVNDRGVFAGITNAAGGVRPGAPSRGLLPLRALEEDSARAAAQAVAAHAAPYAPFQLVLADGDELFVVAHRDGVTTTTPVPGGLAILSNEHALGELALPGVDAARAAGLDARARLLALESLLLDEGGPGRHRILKRGGAYGTVSSSTVAVPRGDARQLIWRYAPGPPDAVDYSEYGNLGRRLAPG